MKCRNKFTIAVVLITLIAVLAGCGENGVQEITVGDTIVTETREITINHVEFSYDVVKTHSIFPDGGGVLIDDHHTPESGKVFIDVDFTVKNLQKQELDCVDVMTAEANYNDGYTYTGYVLMEHRTAGLVMATVSSIAPLVTVNMRYFIVCPQEVEKNTDAPVFVVLTVEGVEYKLIIR